MLNITVTPSNRHEGTRLLNYITSPDVLVYSAALASCALPGLLKIAKKDAPNLVLLFYL